jgi:threonyl-tRNA synthetase
MKILTLHVDYIKFKALKKALKSIEDLSEKDMEEQEVKEALVVMTAVEKTDADVKEAVKRLVAEIKNVASQVKAENIVLYPYAHLSSNLSSPQTAVSVLEEAEKVLKKDFKVVRAPFGYYKEFELKVKGHPLSELSREIVLQGSEEEKYDSKQLLREISKSKLDTSKLKENDHRILGKKLDLFSFSEVAPGMVFWHDKGLIIYDELVKFWREEHRKENYQIIKTPQIMDSKLWKVSGHWEKYKDNNFVTKYEKRDFLVKPMNCPGGMIVYKNSPKSYKDFPMRVGEIGVVHRTELSGVLAGLFRVIQFTQDDAHIFCANEKQVEEEIIRIVNMIDRFYKKFDLEFDHVELSTRPEKRIGSDKIWDMAEKILEKVLNKLKMKYKINEGDGAFYGPKIDFHVKDSQGRTWQLSTVQLDFAMPERFELEYNNKDNEMKRPIMLHRVIYGSIERFIGILLEHTNGNLPLWLSPIQVKVMNMTDNNLKYAKQIYEVLKEEGIRVELDDSAESMGKKVRNAQMQKVNYMIAIGDKEEKAEVLAVRNRKGEIEYDVKLNDFVSKLKKEIADRK